MVGLEFSVLLNLPRIIAVLEYAFPNGIYAPLGRDAVMLGDALDAFYRSIGKTGRVFRINGSGTTIKNAAPHELLHYLMSEGLNVSGLSTETPLVIMDRTEFGAGSQSRHILKAIYPALNAKGLSRTDLLKTANAVTFIGNKSENHFEAERWNKPGENSSALLIDTFQKTHMKLLAKKDQPQFLGKVLVAATKARMKKFIDDRCSSLFGST